MAAEDDARSKDTAAPARNFTLGAEQRMRALAGPPAYARRKRLIEDLEEVMMRELREALAEAAPKGGGDEETVTAALYARAATFDLERLNDLIERHNRYYPAEANLPIHPRTGALLERGAPWSPLPMMTARLLIARFRARR
jgi:hypothetical protein